MIKHKKPIIVILLMILTFNLSSVFFIQKEEKKAHALVAEIAMLFGIGVSTGAFSTFVNVMQSNGYHMELGQAAGIFTNEFYTKVNDRYVAKQGKETTIEHMERWLLNKLVNGATADLPSITDLVPELASSLNVGEVNNIPNDDLLLPSNVIATTFPYTYGGSNVPINQFKQSAYGQFPTYHYLWKDTLGYGKRTQKIYLQDYSDWFYIETETFSSGGIINRVITRDNQVQTAEFQGLIWDWSVTKNTDGSFNITNLMGRNRTPESLTYKPKTIFDPASVVSAIPGSYAADPSVPIRDPNINFYDVLNGVGSNAQEILDVINTNATTQQAILDRLEEVNYNTDFAQAIPKYDPITGKIVYDQDIPASTDSDRLWGIGSALNKIYEFIKTIGNIITSSVTNAWNNNVVPWVIDFWDTTKVNIQVATDTLIGLPGAIAERIGLLWQDVINPAFNEFWDTVVTALTNIKDIAIAIPIDIARAISDGIATVIDWFEMVFVPTATDLTTTFTPVIDLFNLKIMPVLLPFKNLSFYEKEYEDVYVNLKFGNNTSTYKIIDYQYVKQSRDSVKSLIRAFFWILILFFNLDQVHRLIRNQSIIKTYIRKMDTPGGEK